MSYIVKGNQTVGIPSEAHKQVYDNGKSTLTSGFTGDAIDELDTKTNQLKENLDIRPLTVVTGTSRVELVSWQAFQMGKLVYVSAYLSTNDTIDSTHSLIGFSEIDNIQSVLISESTFSMGTVSNSYIPYPAIRVSDNGKYLKQTRSDNISANQVISIFAICQLA